MYSPMHPTAMKELTLSTLSAELTLSTERKELAESKLMIDRMVPMLANENVERTENDDMNEYIDRPKKTRSVTPRMIDFLVASTTGSGGR